jgi:hypothetical protein
MCPFSKLDVYENKEQDIGSFHPTQHLQINFFSIGKVGTVIRAVLLIKIFQCSIETLFITGSIEHDTSFCLDGLLNLQKFKRLKKVRISLSPFEMIDNETTANKVATFFTSFNPPNLRRLRFDGPCGFQCTKFLNLALQRPYNIVEVTGEILCICDTDNEP